MKGKLTLKVLEFLEAGAASTEEILNIFLTDYHTSYRRLRGIPEYPKKRERRYDPEIEEIKIQRAARQSFYDLMSRLKRDELVRKINESRWKITKQGLVKKLKLILKQKNSLPAPKYDARESNEWTIVIFDIPERESRKREWLRAALTRLGLKMFQKSVWIGKVIFPEEFIRDLAKLQLVSYVEILAITKKGSLRRLAG